MCFPASFVDGFVVELQEVEGVSEELRRRLVAVVTRVRRALKPVSDVWVVGEEEE